MPSHKQPIHQQYLTCALRDSGKRQLDCLGIATAVLAICQQLSAEDSDLSGCHMMVSDDHCWIVVEPAAAAAASNKDIRVEVTDCRYD